MKQCRRANFHKKDWAIIIKCTMEAEEKFLRTLGPLKRGLFHIIGGLFIPVVALFVPGMFLVISLCVVTFTFLAFELIRFKAPAINRWFCSFFKPLLREEEASRLTGAS